MREEKTMSEHVKVFTAEDMKPEKLTGLTLVDFWATWCGPCRMVAPIVEEIAAQYADKVVVAKVDVDEMGSLAQRYRIMNIPTLLFFKGGQLVDKTVGAMPKNVLVDKINANL
jgi:thioredoxin 1